MNTTTPLYQHDPYQKQFDATILQLKDNALILDQTCFYPMSGGQPGDIGTLNQIPVTDTRFDQDKQTILHFVDSPESFQEGNLVEGIIDWDRRFLLMRLHSALHIVYLAFVDFYNQQKIFGSNISQEHARLDLEFFDPIDIEQLQEKTNQIISMGFPIERYSDPNNLNKTWWKIGSYLPIPCGGTHPANTSEIGTVSCQIKKLGSQGQRIYVSLEDSSTGPQSSL